MKLFTVLAFLIFCFLTLNSTAQDSTISGTIKVKRQIDETFLEDENKDGEGREGQNLMRRRGGIYHHGPLLGIDYSSYFGYRAGFQYSDNFFVLRLCFRHLVSEKLAGASAAVELPMSVLLGKSARAYTYRLGTEWTSLGRSSNWYQSLNFYFSKVFVLPRGPNIILSAGYQINPVKNQAENLSLNGFSSSLIFHF